MRFPQENGWSLGIRWRRRARVRHQRSSLAELERPAASGQPGRIIRNRREASLVLLVGASSGQRPAARASTVSSELSPQCREHAANLGRLVRESGMVCATQVPEVERQEKLVLHLVCRACGNADKAREVAVGVTPAALRQIRRNGDCAATKLAGQAIPLGAWERLGGSVDAKGKLMRLLPNKQSPVVAHVLPLKTTTTENTGGQQPNRR